MMNVRRVCPAIAAAAILFFSLPVSAEPVLRWDSPDIVESRLTNYAYHRIGPEYERSDDPKAPDPGRNFMIELTVSDEPPKIVDRVLTRHGVIVGSIDGVPSKATIARVWLEDNYGRILDEVRSKAPGVAFHLDASRSLGTGIYLNAELLDGDAVVWRGSQDIRMVPTDVDPWGDFVLGIYNMGTKPGTGELLREMGLTHRAIQTTAPGTFPVQNDLGFHASNILYSLLGLYHRDYKRWREIQAAQAESRGPIELARHRCLSNPKEQKFTTDILTAAGLRHRPFQPLHYGIGDEIGIGNMCGPYDLCGSEWCKARFRDWLRARYATVAQVNAQWQTAYQTWDAVEMFSTWQALGRAETGNFAPWADRVEFMDDVLNGAIAIGVRTIRRYDPNARCSITGVQQPSCWGYDHWKLTRTVNAMTPYDIGESAETIMSFYNDGRDGKIIDPGFGTDNEDLWRSFIRGYDMAQQWDQFGDVYSKMFDIERGELTDLGKSVKTFADWVHAGPGRMRNRATRWRDPVAILYSQPSLRGNWILEITHRTDVPQTGDDWPSRDAWTVRQKELSYRVRLSWLMWLHDIGIRPKFVDVSQVDEDYLATNGYKVLILPRSVALSDTTAAAVRKFVQAGGTVIADTWPGILDQTCRVRPAGVLDDLFGVTRDDYRKIDVTHLPPDGQGVSVENVTLPFVAFETTLKATTGKSGGSIKDADIAITRSVGKGRAIYLNFNLEEYFQQRFFPDMIAPSRRYLASLLAQSGVEPLFKLSVPGSDAPFHPVGHDVTVYRSGRGYLVGVMINPTRRTSELGGIESRYEFIKDHVFLKDHHSARLTVPKGYYAYDTTERKPLGCVPSIEFVSKRNAARVFAVWPFEISNIVATAEVTEDRHLRVNGKLLTSQPVRDEALVVAMRVMRPDGSEQRAYRRTIDCTAGAFATDLPLGVNERGQWTVELTEPCTGKRIGLRVELPWPRAASDRDVSVLGQEREILSQVNTVQTVTFR